jgi:4-amino-4-deoxy-L-arabinose transferase-like glycosyltransferase
MSLPAPADQRLPKLATGGLLLVALLLAVFRADQFPLLGPDEPRYTRVAVEMHRADEWVRPTLQGEPWLEKPILFYWLASAAFDLFGETETAARLPSNLAAVALVGLTALFGARTLGARGGLLAGGLLATAVLPFVYARAASMDMLLAAAVTAAVALCGLRLLGVAGGAAWPAAFAAMGLATLAKGPLGIVLPLLVLMAWSAATRQASPLFQLLRPANLLALVLVAGPWYGAILLDQGWHFVDVFILNHNLARMTSTIHNHPGPFWYYVPVLLVGLFPWSGLVVPAVVGAAPRRSRIDLFLLCWLLAPLAFFSSAGSKLPGYILPCLPPLALLCAQAALRIDRERGGWGWGRFAALLTLVLGAVLFAAPFAWARRGETGALALWPAGAWALLTAFLFSRRIAKDAFAAYRALAIGGGGLLLLFALSLPTLLSRLESGRALFAPARGREVLAWGAWRTAWMAGYFYNDGRVREIEGIADVARAVESGPALVLAGPAQRRELERAPGLEAFALAEGPRRNALLRVKRAGSGF